MTRIHRLAACWLAVLVAWVTPAAGGDGGSWQLPQGFVASATATSERPAELALQRVWSRTTDGLAQQIVESTPRRQMSLAQHLALWRRRHACAVQPAHDVVPLTWAGDQQSLGGSCEGGDVFVMYVARIAGKFVEFHVALPSGAPGAPDPQRLRASLRALLGEVAPPVVVDGEPTRSPDRRMSRGQARRSIERLPTVAALGERVRLQPLPDAADIGPGGCTGSAGECMYWFRAEERTDNRWSFFRLFAVCPYDGAAYVSTTPDRQRAQRGAYEPVGPRRHGKSGSQSNGQRSAPPTIKDESWFGPP